jgi:hypothetical protein
MFRVRIFWAAQALPPPTAITSASVAATFA